MMFLNKKGAYYASRKAPKYGVCSSGPYYPGFSLNTRKYGPERTPYLDTSYSIMIHMINNPVFNGNYYFLQFSSKSDSVCCGVRTLSNIWDGAFRENSYKLLKIEL